MTKECEKRRTDPERHSRNCTVCKSPCRQSIERAFVEWEPPARIARQYGLQRSSLYLHAYALGLMDKRNANVKAALARLIERSGRVQPNASALVSACVALSKLNEAGRTEERIISTSTLEGVFESMTRGELEAYAVHGTVPERLKEVLTATPKPSNEKREVGNGTVN